MKKIKNSFYDFGINFLEEKIKFLLFQLEWKIVGGLAIREGYQKFLGFLIYNAG